MRTCCQCVAWSGPRRVLSRDFSKGFQYEYLEGQCSECGRVYVKVHPSVPGEHVRLIRRHVAREFLGKFFEDARYCTVIYSVSLPSFQEKYC